MVSQMKDSLLLQLNVAMKKALDSIQQTTFGGEIQRIGVTGFQVDLASGSNIKKELTTMFRSYSLALEFSQQSPRKRKEAKAPEEETNMIPLYISRNYQIPMIETGNSKIKNSVEELKLAESKEPETRPKKKEGRSMTKEFFEAELEKIKYKFLGEPSSQKIELEDPPNQSLLLLPSAIKGFDPKVRNSERTLPRCEEIRRDKKVASSTSMLKQLKEQQEEENGSKYSPLFS